jgi:hypothetical protein
MSRYLRSTHTYNLRVCHFVSYPPFPSILTDDHDAFRAAAIIFQAMLFTVTIYKFILAVRDGWGDVALIVLLTRDGTWAFCLLFCASSFYRSSIWVMLNLSLFCFIFISRLCGTHCVVCITRWCLCGCLIWVSDFFLESVLVPLLIMLLDGFWLYSHFVYVKPQKRNLLKCFFSNSLILGLSCPSQPLQFRKQQQRRPLLFNQPTHKYQHPILNAMSNSSNIQFV